VPTSKYASVTTTWSSNQLAGVLGAGLERHGSTQAPCLAHEAAGRGLQESGEAAKTVHDCPPQSPSNSAAFVVTPTTTDQSSLPVSLLTPTNCHFFSRGCHR
jgi:hypothetical protein